jgi:hypothetical protein
MYDGVKLGLDWQMTHVEFDNGVVQLHNSERKKSSPHNITLGSRESLKKEPTSTPPQV